MKTRCVWEHNGNDSILYSEEYIGAYTRGNTKEEAIRKMSSEILSYAVWAGISLPDPPEPEIVQEKNPCLWFPMPIRMCFSSGNARR